MSADAVAVLIRQKHVVGTDGDEPGVTDFHLVMKLDQTLGLAPILRAESSPAKHQNHRIWPLKIGNLPTFARVIGQLIIGKQCASYNVRSHTIQPPLRKCHGTSARAPLAQSTSFCTAGAPLSPIAPTISPSTLIGNPPPQAATRESVGMPAKSDGSPWIKLKKSCVETPNRAVYALFSAISMQRIGAPSIRLNALRFPPSSRIATFSLTPISLAFAIALSTIFC